MCICQRVKRKPSGRHYAQEEKSLLAELWDRLNDYLSHTGVDLRRPRPKKEYAYLFMCIIGWLGYAIFALFLAVFLSAHVFFFHFMFTLIAKEGGLGGVIFTIVNFLFVMIFRICAGFMGWGAAVSKMSDIPFRMFSSIRKNTPPSRFTFIWFFPTIGSVGLFIYTGVKLSIEAQSLR